MFAGYWVQGPAHIFCCGKRSPFRTVPVALMF